MASDGREELDFQYKLRAEILGIASLGGWIQPDYVLIREDASALLTEKFPEALIVLADFYTVDDAHKFAVSGEIKFGCAIYVAVRNPERRDGPVPARLAGFSARPSLALIDGALRNEFHLNTLGGWCYDTELGPGTPIEKAMLPEGCTGRQYLFLALKEVSR
jgi:hypothetical protein